MREVIKESGLLVLQIIHLAIVVAGLVIMIR